MDGQERIEIGSAGFGEASNSTLTDRARQSAASDGRAEVNDLDREEARRQLNDPLSPREDADELIAEPAVKQRLIENTNQAIAAGVFGVPTFECHGELFWGSDTIEWMKEFLSAPALFSSSEMRRVDALPMGSERSARRSA